MNILTNAFSSSKISYCGLGFVLTLISGIVLSKSGRPLNSAIFAVHKLSAVGTAILIILIIRDFAKTVDMQLIYAIILGIIALLFLALFVSGSLLSFDRTAVQPILRIHQIAPLLAVLFSTISIYLLVSNKS